jgi:CheY-like chemotaxis protein
VVGNLVGNAIKFTPNGGRVRVDARLEGEAEITVSDTGCGISRQFLSHVFERFRQEAISTITGNRDGLGLGLAIARHIVELHGGRIEAESDGVGRGSTFRARLPLSPSPAPFREASAAKAEANLSGIGVLVVEDDADTRLALEIILREAGSRVRTAETVRQALHAFADERPDVIVTDLGLSGEDGYALQKALRRLDADWRHSVPVIALTGAAMPEDRQRVREAGFALHVAKPVEPAELLDAIKRVASGRRS